MRRMYCFGSLPAGVQAGFRNGQTTPETAAEIALYLVREM